MQTEPDKRPPDAWARPAKPARGTTITMAIIAIATFVIVGGMVPFAASTSSIVVGIATGAACALLVPFAIDRVARAMYRGSRRWREADRYLHVQVILNGAVFAVLVMKLTSAWGATLNSVRSPIGIEEVIAFYGCAACAYAVGLTVATWRLSSLHARDRVAASDAIAAEVDAP
jgi:amino acid transporter